MSVLVCTDETPCVQEVTIISRTECHPLYFTCQLQLFIEKRVTHPVEDYEHINIESQYVIWQVDHSVRVFVLDIGDISILADYMKKMHHKYVKRVGGFFVLSV